MKVLRFLLGLAFGTAGVLHFTRERQFRNIVPDYLPLQKTAVLVTGVIEIFFGIMLLIKRPASWLKKGILPLGDKELPKWALYSRLPLQFVLIKAIKKL
ncbi:MAG: hypothetical protein E6350_09440 [Staphylococcus epidermidis]|nr:hypothetical protein [Staphylococcus epidermidis]